MPLANLWIQRRSKGCGSSANQLGPRHDGERPADIDGMRPANFWLRLSIRGIDAVNLWLPEMSFQHRIE